MGKARCGREPGFTAETVKLLEGYLQAGREWGLKAGVGGGGWRSWCNEDPATESESQSPVTSL